MQKLKTDFILFHLCFSAADREKKDARSSRCIYKKRKSRKIIPLWFSLRQQSWRKAADPSLLPFYSSSLRHRVASRRKQSGSTHKKVVNNRVFDQDFFVVVMKHCMEVKRNKMWCLVLGHSRPQCLRVWECSLSSTSAKELWVEIGPGSMVNSGLHSFFF